jgi:hypothetical protein
MVRELEWPPNGTVMWCGPVSELRGNNAVESEETIEMPDLSGITENNQCTFHITAASRDFVGIGLPAEL